MTIFIDHEKPVTISNHGRITLPARFRKKYNLHDGDQVQLIEDEGTLRIIPILDIEELRKNSCTVDEMKQIMAETRREDLEREM